MAQRRLSALGQAKPLIGKRKEKNEYVPYLNVKRRAFGFRKDQPGLSVHRKNQIHHKFRGPLNVILFMAL